MIEPLQLKDNAILKKKGEMIEIVNSLSKIEQKKI